MIVKKLDRVLYYSGYRMSVFHWLDTKLVDSYSFLPNDEGFEQFKFYLNNNKNNVLRIVVDVIEEDYFKDSFPHVSKKDRQALLLRRVSRNHPKCIDWFNGRVISREKHGRKDDLVIYSVMTNPSILMPWIDILIKSKTPVIGIWSVSLLSEKLIKLMAIEDKNSLLVSQQVPSNIRQSFFEKGELRTSRSGGVNLQEMSLAEHISKEINQTSSFLANQRYIGFDEILVVHMIFPEKQIKEIKAELEDSALRQYRYHKLEEVMQKADLIVKNKDFCNIIFSNICRQQASISRQYNPKGLFKFNRIKKLSRFIIFSSAAVFIFACLGGLYYTYENNLLNNEIRLDSQNTHLIEVNYEREFGPIQKHLNMAVGTQSAVLFSKQLSRSKDRSIQEVLFLISDLLKRTGIEDIQLSNISWYKTQKSKFIKRSSNTKSNIKYIETEKYYDQIKIFGYFSNQSDSLTTLSKKVDKLKKTFSSERRIIDVKLIRLPVDLRSVVKVERVVGDKEKNKSASILRDQFEVQLLIEGI